MSDKEYLELLEAMALLWENGDTSDIKRTKKIIESIYKYAHVGRRDCGNAHLNWQKEAKAMLKSLKDGGIA